MATADPPRPRRAVRDRARRHAPAADQRLLDGVIFGQLGAAAEPKAFYAEMQSDDAFRAPLAWADVEPDEFDGLILPGRARAGHAAVPGE